MASDHMHTMPAEALLAWILKDLEQGSALGIVDELFFTPKGDDPFRMERYGVTLETPVGVAAGPHTQMAQNLVAAWLTGARYMELKTVQVLDTISVTKPCIDMADEGYNCEWSQELTLDGSYEEYLKAWVIVHVLHDKLFGPGRPGMIFNMSAGYSMEGILSPKVQRFLDRMGDCAADVEALKKRLAPLYPRIAELDIPGRISDNLTISCMHGCPPDEVEKIALYFVEQRRYNTTLKMNPTLPGPGCVRGLLHDTLGYETEIPDLAFEHDLPYDEALRILGNCIEAAKQTGVAFGVKLTNTLESVNRKQNLPDSEKMVYLSGRALHPIAIALAAKLQTHFGGNLDISFCAGLDSLNIADSLACGLAPLTVCSDLLKPGGYGRMAQYMAELRTAMRGASGIEDFIVTRAGTGDYKSAMLKNLDSYAEKVREPNSRYAKKAAGNPDVKNSRALPALDCAAAPCATACPAGQEVPAYLALAAAGDLQGSLGVILRTNPFPAVLGKMCNQACRAKCMRKHYDQALRIRDIKACAAAGGGEGCFAPPQAQAQNGRSVAVLGAGPDGLACAYFLALAGCSVRVHNTSDKPGGPVMVKMSKDAELVEKDLARIRQAGVEFVPGQAVDAAALGAAHDALYASPGYEGRSLSLVEAVGEGRAAATRIAARLGLVPGQSAQRELPLDIRALRVKQAFRQDDGGKAGAFAGPDMITEAGREAARCLQCDRYCGICVSVCPNRANVLLAAAPREWPVQQAVQNADGTTGIVTLARGRVAMNWQVVNLGDFCNECGNCASFCPSADAPYRAKQRVHLSRASFDADENGFLFTATERIEGKTGGKNWTLHKDGPDIVFEDATLTAVLDGESLAARAVTIKNGAATASLAQAVQAALFLSLVEADPGLQSAVTKAVQK